MLIQITTESLALTLSSELKVLIAFYSPTGVCQMLANCSQWCNLQSQTLASH